MSGFGDPSPQHQNALSAVDEARQRALGAVSEMRQRGTSGHHPNLAPAGGEDPPLASLCTQAAADYLLQLRPYRANSRSWEVDMGGVELPTEIPGGTSNRLGKKRKPPLYLCRQPVVPIRNVSDLIDAANMTVQYSTKKSPPEHPGSSALDSGSRWVAETEDHGEVEFRDKSAWKAVASGALSVQEALDTGIAISEEQLDDNVEHAEQDKYVPADPNVGEVSGRARGPDHKVRTYNLVFPAGTLLRFVQLADEVAAELDLLADLESPDYEPGGGGAV